MATNNFTQQTLCLQNNPFYRLNKICAALAVAIPLSFSMPASAGLVTQEVVFTSLNQSMWGEGESTVFSNFDDPVFIGAEWDQSGKLFEIGRATNGNNGVKVEGQTSGKIGLETGWSIDSGTVNTQLPFSFEIDIPDRRNLRNNDTFAFGVTSATLDSQAFLETISPSLQLYADLIVKAQASLDVKGCYDAFFASDCGSASVDLLNFDTTRELLSVNTGPDRDRAEKDGQIRVLDGFKELFAAGATAKDLIETEKDENGKTKKVSIKLEPVVSVGGSPLIEVDVRIPDITEKSTLNSSVNLGSNGQSNILGTSGTDEFLNLNVDIDQLATNLRILPPLGGNASVDFGVGSISTEFDLLDLSFIPSLSLDQDFSLSIDKIGVSYEIERFDNIGNIISSQILVANSLTDEFNLIWNDSQSINITPIYQISASLHNKTGVSVNFDFNVDILKGSISAEIFGIDIGNESFGPLAQLANFDLPSADLLTLFDSSFGLKGFSPIKGSTIGLDIVSRTFDGSGTSNWSLDSSWVEDIAPDSFADVQVISGQVNVTGVQESGNLNVDSGAGVNVFGSLSVSGENIDNSGRIFVKGTVSPNTGELIIDALNLSGNGDILLNSGTISSSNRNEVRFLRGQDIVVANRDFFFRDSSIEDISLELSNGSEIETLVNENLSIVNSSIVNANTSAFELNGVTTLTNSNITNIDLANGATFKIGENSGVNVTSTINTGLDNIFFIGSDALMKVSSSMANIDNALVFEGVLGVSEIQNNGLIEVSTEFSGIGATARLLLGRTNRDTEAETFLFSGTGRIDLLGASIAPTVAANPINLINGKGHTIRGTGGIGVLNGTNGLVNNGEIWSQRLTDDPRVSGRLTIQAQLDNNGIVGAKGPNQIMDINGFRAVKHVVVTAGSNGLGDMTLTGGTWAAEDGGTMLFTVSRKIRNFFTNRANLVLNGADSDIVITDGLGDAGKTSLGKSGEVRVANFNNQGSLSLIDNDFVALNMFNTGVVNLSDTAYLTGLDTNQGQINMASDSRLVFMSKNSEGAVVQGNGEIFNFSFLNEGTINAADGELWVRLLGTQSSFTNTGTMAALDGGKLYLTGLKERSSQLGNAEFSGGGTWGAYAEDSEASIVIASRGAGDINGIKTLHNTHLTLSGEDAKFYTETESQLISLENSLSLITDSASLTLANGQGFQSRQLLTNAGSLNFAGGAFVGSQLVNDGNIEGFGTVLANINNNNVIKATGGLLTITGSIDNTNGNIEVGSGDSSAKGERKDALNMVSGFVEGGDILVKENATLLGAGSFLDVLLTNKGTISISSQASSSFVLKAGSSNSGEIKADNGARAFFGNLYGDELDNTSGKISANDGELALLNYNISGGEIELTGAQSELLGTGVLNEVALRVSNGTISAQSNGQEGLNQLKISTSQLSQLNNATLQANKDSILLLENAQFDGKGGSTILANNDANVQLQNVVLNNISLDTEGNGKITDLATSHLTNVLIAGNIDVASTGQTNLYGSNVLSGNLSTTGGSEIVMHGARLTGQNVITQDINGETEILSIVTPGNLTISAGATLRGAGTVDLVNISNNGAMIADGAQALIIDVNGERFDNAGVLRADGAGGLNLLDELVVNTGSVEVNSTLSITGDYEQLSGTTKVNGRVSSGSFIILDGSLEGNGLIESQVYLGESAELNMLNSLDSLTIADNMDLFGSVSVDLFSIDSFDTLSVNGDLNLSETTQFLFELASNIELFDNLSFEFLFFENVFNLDLLNPLNISFNRDISGYKWLFAFNDDETSLRLRFVDVNAPAQIALFLLGLAYLIRRKGSVKK